MGSTVSPVKCDIAAAIVPKMDTNLFNQLRNLRRQISEKDQTPLYMIFSNASLEAMATYFPQTKDHLSRMKGVGKYKIYKYGDQIISVIATYCCENKIVSKMDLLPEEQDTVDAGRIKSTEATVLYFKQGLSLQEIAELRKLSLATIKSHLLQAYIDGQDIAINSFVPAEKQEFLSNVFKSLATQQLTTVMEYLTNGYSYDDLRWVRAKILREEAVIQK